MTTIDTPRMNVVTKRIASALLDYASRRSAGERGTLVDASAEIDSALDESRQLERDLAAARRLVREQAQQLGEQDNKIHELQQERDRLKAEADSLRAYLNEALNNDTRSTK